MERQDRRTRKTRQQLRGALLALLQEKRYEAISVQDIIERADVARSTFYVHYVDKDDLLTGRQGIFAENLGRHLTAHSGEQHASVFSARLWFQHVQAQGEILQIIAKDPAMNLALKTLRDLIQRGMREGLQPHAPSQPGRVPLSVVEAYLTDALMTLIQWWLKDGMKRTPEEMDEMFQQLVLPGALAVLKGANHETH